MAALLALLFFFGPALAFVLGVRPEAIENRPLADLPSPTEGWDFFPAFSTWSTDHLPLRAQAVRFNAELSQRVFGEAPSYGTDPGGPATGIPSGDSSATQTDGAPAAAQYPRVLEGQDGWLYFGPDVAEPCQATRSLDEVFHRVDRLRSAVEASGRTFVVTVAPDKSTMVAGSLPDTYLGQDCATERRTAFWETLRATPPTGYLDLRGPLEAAQEATGDPIYRPTDTHWGPRGAAVYTEQLATRLDSALMDGTRFVETGPTSQPGDLADMLGLPHDDPVEGVELRRDGVTPVGRDSLEVSELSDRPDRVLNETNGAPLFQPRTVLLGDSFTNASTAMIGQFFADLTLLHNEVAADSPQTVADALAESDVVVYEIVERVFIADGGPLLDDASLSAIESTLAANPR
ncbi:alginate O-acetyltransferase AlgX-related protein [Modestobacter versicolor]|uniref:AlgX/AlgJ SGNH hydrolase-like domain-containing protein n=1 Tax=Modestobacter versicolor TaxID=429133 RepID=A0A839Y8K9_9ACTN|nr:hypothetical protein [Modestobacter versicolor]MBB3678707.1 hypothetical protein [Modestobacter versicolor]